MIVGPCYPDKYSISTGTDFYWSGKKSRDVKFLFVYVDVQLEAMGFDRALVLEVFFACNKNEELAANYLLDHMHEFDE